MGAADCTTMRSRPLRTCQGGSISSPGGMEGAGPDGCGGEECGLTHCDSGRLCGHGSRGRASPVLICC